MNHDAVQVGEIVAVLMDNAERARSLVKRVAPSVGALDRPCPNGCQRVLDEAIITPPEARTADVTKNLDAVAGRVLNGS